MAGIISQSQAAKFVAAKFNRSTLVSSTFCYKDEVEGENEIEVEMKLKSKIKLN